ncbi:hypothetical protein HDU97_001500 [Phlyctochytrium planicorne]|nr:hypothetical protein HDU97_001500 [Phlyctochytrium planicorne]
MSPIALINSPLSVMHNAAKTSTSSTSSTSKTAGLHPLNQKTLHLQRERQVLFSTGNIASSTVHVGAHPAYSTAIELLTSIESSLQRHIKDINTSSTNSNNRQSRQISAPPTLGSTSPLIHIGNVAPVPSEDEESRDELDVSAKIFFTHHSNPNHVRTSVLHLLHHLRTPYLDTLTAHWTPTSRLLPHPSNLPDLPDLPTPEQDILAGILPFWESLDECQRNDLVRTLGVSGFSQEGLREFMPCARTKPGVVHVNPYEVLDEETKRLAKDVGFEVMVQGDSAEVLSSSAFQELLSQYSIDSLPSHMVTPEWVVKYSVFSKTRGVLLNKGYFVMTTLE